MDKKIQWLIIVLFFSVSSGMISSCSSDEDMEEVITEPEVEYIFSMEDNWGDPDASEAPATKEQCTVSLLSDKNIDPVVAGHFKEQEYFLTDNDDDKSRLIGQGSAKDGRKRGRLVHTSPFHDTFTLWSTGSVFDNTKMTNIEGTQKYTPNKRVAWGSNTQTTIYGIAPHIDTRDVVMSVEDETFTYTVPSVPTNQVDLMVSKVDAQSTDKVINFPFNHILSAIRFKVGDKGIESATKLENITISGIYTTGTYSFETGEWICTDTGSISQDFDDAKDWTIGQLFTDDEKGTTFFVLPQTTPANAKITITLVDEVFGRYTLTAKIGNKTWAKSHAKAYKISKEFDYGELFAAGSVPYQFTSAGGTGTMYVCSSRYKQNGGWTNVIGPLKPARWEFELSSENYFQTYSTSLPNVARLTATLASLPPNFVVK